ncbi:BaiN/RdsA family NAD(P)/FAD-dependent oxidoreductase [Halpernia frigidisoli]|uniref:NAD(P)/FAD-dependent oxidoreductase n=1 Tax=Halpernia frigidisoli TaxID=1125876 RepID=UPI000B7D5784|nr:NAD(P)/FAD-dependent oxidoreductase [Halpernia frigidisoli]
MEKKQVVIIGGGASGFFCAANLDENKYNVLILEQNSDVLQKVKISGGGRCNVSHACFDPRELVNFYPRGNKELRSVFSRFQPGDMMEWLEKRNVEVKIEDDNRVFPISNSSSSIINSFVNEVVNKNFEVKTQQSVQSVIKENNRFLVKTKTDEFVSDYVVYCTGSSPKSLKILEQLNFKIIPLVPSLFTFNIKNETLKDLMGTSFLNAEVSIPALKMEESGPMLITHWGLSGPAILKISAWKALELAKLNYNFEILVNFLGINISDAEDLFKAFKENNPKKAIGTSKIFDITNRFWHRILFVSKINLDKNISQLTKVEIQLILENLCAKKMKVTGKSTYKDEFVTAGGVDLKEINFKTMEAKNIENFYLAGEVLNIDAVTGGFNFQACWSEAWIIAESLNNLN